MNNIGLKNSLGASRFCHTGPVSACFNYYVGLPRTSHHPDLETVASMACAGVVDGLQRADCSAVEEFFKIVAWTSEDEEPEQRELLCFE